MSSPYYVIASPRKIYRIATDVIGAEGFRKYFDLSFCDVHGPYYARNYNHAAQLALESNPEWRLDSKLKEILCSLQ